MSKRLSIARNSLYNVAGWMIPATVQIVSVPYIVKNLGYDNYGIWSLAMAVMGYFAFLDMNMLKAGIRFLAEYHGKKDIVSANQVVTFGMLTFFVIGLVGMIAIALCVDPVILKMVKIPEELHTVARSTLYLASLGFLLIMIQNYLLSIPKALHRFDVSNVIEMSFTVGSILATVSLLYFGYGLLEVVIARLLANVICILVAYGSIKKVMPYFKFSIHIESSLMKKIFSYSLVSFAGRIGMATKSFANTFVAGSLLGTSAITFFTVPYMLVERLTNISSRLSMVIFPIASEMGSQSRHDELIIIYRKMTRHVFNINIFLTTLISLFSWEIMTLWMGEAFAKKSALILLLVAIGFLFNTTTGLPSLVNDGIGHPKVTSTFAFVSGAISVVFLFIFGKIYGLVGIAIGYSASSILMAVMFNVYIHDKVIGISWKEIIRTSYLSAIVFSLCAVTVVIFLRINNIIPEPNIFIFIFEVIVYALLYCSFSYLFILDYQDRVRVIAFLSRLINRKNVEQQI